MRMRAPMRQFLRKDFKILFPPSLGSHDLSTEARQNISVVEPDGIERTASKERWRMLHIRLCMMQSCETTLNREALS